mmetsp:Transcript_42237/g.105482  ORF Transcript_42237/g.105482 Transcript_42237/m.105482 type:complete len:113 (-) Transcript_42237:149-487(-)
MSMCWTSPQPLPLPSSNKKSSSRSRRRQGLQRMQTSNNLTEKAATTAVGREGGREEVNEWVVGCGVQSMDGWMDGHTGVHGDFPIQREMCAYRRWWPVNGARHCKCIHEGSS